MTGYEMGILSYIDILGFSDLIDESKKGDPQVIERIAWLLHTFERQFTSGGRVAFDANRVPKDLFHYRNFSDLMLRLTLMEGEDLVQAVNWEIWSLAQRQMAIVGEGILLRGAVTMDNVYCKHNLIFGPAVVNGYKMEQGLAIYPRIVIDDKLMFKTRSSLSTTTRLWTEYFCYGDDGVEFVDYLVGAFLDRHSQRAQGIEPHEVLQRHKQVVLTKLSELDSKDTKIKAKVWWMWHYHNRSIDRIIDICRPDAPTIDKLKECRLLTR
jgi:hypothetical protein